MSLLGYITLGSILELQICLFLLHWMMGVICFGFLVTVSNVLLYLPVITPVWIRISISTIQLAQAPANIYPAAIGYVNWDRTAKALHSRALIMPSTIQKILQVLACLLKMYYISHRAVTIHQMHLCKL
uniref:Uncharacterized protein n=1 Tax=Opuntia streptacantha TaxID=393608 RepID=A0A7C9F0D0_OPUST